MYDLVIVGAGPAGLMAAKTAAEQGLKVLLIEKKKNISKITRACCQQLIMDENYSGETLKIEEGKIIFTKNDFNVSYNGPLVPIVDKYFVSSGNKKVHFAYTDRRPIVMKFDKGLLLQGLLDECINSGVEVRYGVSVSAASSGKKGVSLELQSGSSHETVQAKKIIISDGVNTPTAGKFGINKNRTAYATALCTLSVLEGVRDSDSHTITSFMGTAYQSFAPVILGQSVEKEDLRYLVLIGNNTKKPEQIYSDLITKSPLAQMLSSAKVIKKTACMVTAFSPLKTPFEGNVLVIGDAAAYVEVEVQGALACGFRAGNAVAEELNGSAGFEKYSRWWQDSFEFNSDDYLQVAQGFALVPTYSDDELDYLFSLIEDETLPGTFSQYVTPRLLWKAILKHHDRIIKERPDIHNKIKNNNQLSLGDVL